MPRWGRRKELNFVVGCAAPLFSFAAAADDISRWLFVSVGPHTRARARVRRAPFERNLFAVIKEAAISFLFPARVGVRESRA